MVAWRRIHVYTEAALVAWRRIQVYRSSIGSMEEDTDIQKQCW